MTRPGVSGHQPPSYRHTTGLSAFIPGTTQQTGGNIWTMKNEDDRIVPLYDLHVYSSICLLCIQYVNQRGNDRAIILSHMYFYEHKEVWFCAMVKCKRTSSCELDGRSLTSLNSWIWACSNIENTLELAPSAVLFLAFLGAFRQHKWKLNIRCDQIDKNKFDYVYMNTLHCTVDNS